MAGTASDLTKCLEALNRHWMEAYVNGDVAFLEQHLGDEYVSTFPDGARQEERNRAASIPRRSPPDPCESTIEACVKDRDEWVVPIYRCMDQVRRTVARRCEPSHANRRAVKTLGRCREQEDITPCM